MSGSSRALAAIAIVTVGEPLVYVTAMLCATAYVFRLARSVPYGHALTAIAMTLGYAIACWLLTARLERRAKTQARVLTKRFVALGGDLGEVLPPRRRNMRERLECRMSLSQRLVGDALERVLETPCMWARAVCAWTVLVFASAAVGRWLWQLVLHRGLVDLLALIAIVPCSVAFLVAWNDLRLGRRCRLRRARDPGHWAAGHSPEPTPTVIPTAPVLVLMFVPAIALGMIWSHGGSIDSRLKFTEAVFALWALLWGYRRAIAGSREFRRVEQLGARLDDFIRLAAAPTWTLVVQARRWCGWGAAAIFAMALSWPRSLSAPPAGSLIGVAVALLSVTALLTPFAALHLSQPVATRTLSAEQLLKRQGKAEARRVSMMLNVGLVALMLLLIVLAVPI